MLMCKSPVVTSRLTSRDPELRLLGLLASPTDSRDPKMTFVPRRYHPQQIAHKISLSCSLLSLFFFSLQITRKSSTNT